MALESCPSCGTDFAGGSGRCGNCGYFEDAMAPEGAVAVEDHPDAEVVHVAEPVTDAGTESGDTEADEKAGELTGEAVEDKGAESGTEAPAGSAEGDSDGAAASDHTHELPPA